jgi:hypothetical protein
MGNVPALSSACTEHARTLFLDGGFREFHSNAVISGSLIASISSPLVLFWKDSAPGTRI